MRLVREFSLPPGDYDMEAVVGDSRPGVGLVGVAKARLSVPDIRGGSLVATPIVLGEASKTLRADSLPFIFGQTTLTPATDRRFPQSGGVSVAFRLYNWTAAEGEKPDLTVEYLFYEKGLREAGEVARPMIGLLKRLGYAPRTCVWELTLACNMNCRHCGSRAGKARPDELTQPEALRLCQDLADLGVKRLTLGGGEPHAAAGLDHDRRGARRARRDA